MRDVVQRYSVAETTIRRATENGSLTCLTLPSGHRRFREADVLEWLGIDIEAEEKKGNVGVRIAAIVRVSTSGQNRKVGNSDKSSLEHQEGRVKEYIDERWGRTAKVTWYKSVGSGMNFERKEFLQLIQDVLAGKYRGGFILATDFTRVCRFGIKMVEFLAKQGGCQIVYTMNDEAKELQESLSDEILSILTHYTARASGAKSKALNETKLSEDQLRDCFLWYRSGLSYRGCAERLRQEKRGKDVRGRTISRTVVHKRLKENWATLERLYSSDEVEKNSFEIFVKKYVRKSRTNKTRLSRMRLIESYGEWCKREDTNELSSRRISLFTKKLGWERKLDAKGAVVFCGLSMLPADKGMGG